MSDYAKQQGAGPQRELDLSTNLDELARQDRARLQGLDTLYLPLREAVEEELGKTEPGRNVLDETRVLGEQLNEVVRSVSSPGASKEAQLMLQGPLMKFRERHEEQLLAAQAPYVHLRPPIEAVAQILHPELPADTVWLSEASPFRAMLLEPKPTLSLVEVDTVGQGLGDPGAMCVIPPYGRREEYPLAPAVGDVQCGAELDGRLYQLGLVVSLLFVPQAAIANAWVGNDFSVPAGFTTYEVIVDYEYLQTGIATAILGLAVINQDVAILVDNLDGTFMKSAQSISTMIVPVAAGDGYRRQGKTKVTLPFTRASSAAGTVKVMVGADGHCFAMALAGSAWFGTGVVSVKVNEICVRPVR